MVLLVFAVMVVAGVVCLIASFVYRRRRRSALRKRSLRLFVTGLGLLGAAATWVVMAG